MNLKNSSYILLFYCFLCDQILGSIHDEVDRLASEGLKKLLNKKGNENLKIALGCANGTGRCDPHLNKLGIRKEWGDLNLTEKRNYIDAVLCIQHKPSIIPNHEVPGARTRYDDFLATHINQTLHIHGTGNFLSWHRYFVMTFEKALQEECQYEGHQPYWSWQKYAQDPLNSPLFDGSDYSMSGNGEYLDYGGDGGSLHSMPFYRLPPGQGGGCVTTGPFKNMTVNLGPVLLYGFFSGHSGFDYNPRCLKRDISSFVSKRWTNLEKVVSLIKDNQEISSFQYTMQGRPDQGFLGVHGGGHYTIGGDPGADFFCSPGDPMFFLHHAMIDRLWWIWQNLDLEKREKQIQGTRTMYNIPPSGHTTLDDYIDLGYNGPPIRLEELMSTTELENWYIYL